jgi:hypothetical protein
MGKKKETNRANRGVYEDINPVEVPIHTYETFKKKKETKRIILTWYEKTTIPEILDGNIDGEHVTFPAVAVNLKPGSKIWRFP